MPAPPFPTNLLLRKIFAGTLFLASASQADPVRGRAPATERAKRSGAVRRYCRFRGNGRRTRYNKICRNRLAVWRQLPKLIPAGSTPVSCSKHQEMPFRTEGRCSFYKRYQKRGSPWKKRCGAPVSSGSKKNSCPRWAAPNPSPSPMPPPLQKRRWTRSPSAPRSK